MTKSEERKIRKLIAEAIESNHIAERTEQRLKREKYVNVCFRVGNLKFQNVGTYFLADDIKNKIIDEMEIVKNYNFPKNKTYVVKLTPIVIDRDKIQYYSEELKKLAKIKPLELEMGSSHATCHHIH